MIGFLFFGWLRFLRAKIIAAIILMLMMVASACDMEEPFRAAEKTKQLYEEQKLHQERSKDFGKATPVDVPPLFPTGKVVLK